MLSPNNSLQGIPTPHCLFRVGSQDLAISVNDIKEITKPLPCTPIPHAPLAVAGYVNLRGQIALIAHLRTLLGYSIASDSTEQRIIFLKPNLAPALGFLVDQVGEMLDVASSPFCGKKFSIDGPMDDMLHFRETCDLGNRVVIRVSGEEVLGALRQALLQWEKQSA